MRTFLLWKGQLRETKQLPLWRMQLTIEWLNKKGDVTMDLYTMINKRKSCRNYTGQPFDNEKLSEINDAIKGFKPLDPDVALEWRFIEKMKGPFQVEAPHFLIISGQGKDGEAENAGFMFQQLMLWFNLHEIGSVWLGGPKDINKNPSGKDIVAIAFGEPQTAIQRQESEFERKPIAEITNCPEDLRIKAARFAPSGLNLQPWYFEKEKDGVLLYEQRLMPPISLLYRLTKVDLGIALCHYALACEHLGEPFNFQRREEKGNKKGFRLFGELK